MKKSILVAGFIAFVVIASAQSGKEEPLKPPPPPKPPVGKMKNVPPPPPPPLPSEPPVPSDPPPPPAPTEPPPPPEPPLPPEDGEGSVWISDEYEAFLRRNPSVKSLGWNAKNELIVELKSGKEERYQLDDEKSRKEAEAKYGKLPAAPPPPPPPPARPKKKANRITTT